jgi:hypothetical protein
MPKANDLWLSPTDSLSLLVIRIFADVQYNYMLRAK